MAHAATPDQEQRERRVRLMIIIGLGVVHAAQLACVRLPFMSAPDDEWRRGAPRAWNRSVVTDRGSLRWFGLIIVVLVGFMVVAMLWP